MGKKRCEACECKKSELAEQRLMKSWLCLFFDDVFCPYPKIPCDRRFSSVCFRCVQYKGFMREMDEEDKKMMDEIDDIRAHPERYGYSSGRLS
jgi:hypothetical protein